MSFVNTPINYGTALLEPITMSKYDVVFETRGPGSIGAFFKRTFRVEAQSEREAIDRAFDVAHEQNFETRFPGNVRLVPDTTEQA